MDNQPQLPQPNIQPPKLTLDNKTYKRSLNLLVLIILFLILCVVGVYLWQHHKVNQLNDKVSNYQAALIKDSKTSLLNLELGQVSNSSLSIASADQTLNNFYTKYIASANSTSTSQPASVKKVINDYGTANLLKYAYPSVGAYGANPILCAQDIPTSFSVSSISVSPNVATGTITEGFGSDSAKIVATVIKQADQLKVNSVTCSPALTPSTMPN
jgi:hypothetical protein